MVINSIPQKVYVSWKVTTSPTIEPITVEDVKEFARLDGSTEDGLLSAIVSTVCENAERYLNRALIQQTITLSMDEWPERGYLCLPQPPLVSVTSIKTVDESDTKTTYSSDSYYVQTLPEPGEVVVKIGSSPPTNTARARGGYEIEYKAGYGTSTLDIPQAIRQGLKMWATYIYENRNVNPLLPPPEVSFVLDNYRVIPFTIDR